MRLATYNIWNDKKTIERRLLQLVHEITAVDADVIGLQEVTQPVYDALVEGLGYAHHTFAMYPGEAEGHGGAEGLAIFSKFPMEDVFFLNASAEYANSDALHVLLRAGEASFSITNLHLPWDSALAKEKQIAAIDRYIKTRRDADEYILLGDFNCGLTSSVHNYLLGEQTLFGQESNPYWWDLASTYAAVHGLPNRPTLDFQRNPRWTDNTTEIPVVYDRILISAGGERLDNVELFGTAISPETGLSASDHYGVLADVEF